jgi:hypothetical protein
MKIRKSSHSTWPVFQPEAHHCWPGPVAQPTRAPGVVTARWPHVRPVRARWRLLCSVVDGVNMRTMRGGRRARRMVAWLTKWVGRRQGGGWGDTTAFPRGHSTTAVRSCSMGVSREVREAD